MVGSRSSGLRLPLNFVYLETMSAISTAGAGPNSRSAHSLVNSDTFSFGHLCGSRAKSRKNSMGNSIGLRSPTFTIQIRLASYWRARFICSHTLAMGFVFSHL